MSSTKNIFTIYASQDKDVLQHLLLHLQPLEKDFNIAIWSDDAIKRGQRWKPRSVSRLDNTDVFLFLLSNTFMYCEFIKQDEFKMVIDRYKEGKAIVIPILLDDCPWDVEFTFDDYSFNFGELHVFHKDERPIGDWNPIDKTFTQVAYYVRGLLTSSLKKSALEESANKDQKKILNIKKEKQIAIDFFQEREVNHKVERERKRKKEAETKQRVKENNKLSEEAEAKEVIRKEKRLRQKAEIQKRIKKEVETKRVVQKEMRDNEIAKAQMAVEEKGRGELEKVERDSKREKRLEEIVATQKRATKKNSLARYNYQFKTSNVVEAKRVVQEERRGNEKAKAKMAIEEKIRGQITKSLRETEQDKRLGEIVAAQSRITEKTGLARYNYQFETSKVIEVKRVVQEERRGNEETKAKMPVAEKIGGEITKFLRETEWKIRLAEIVAALKRVMTKNIRTVQNYQVKKATAINQFFKEAKKNISTNKKRRVRSGFLIAALTIFGILIYIYTGDSKKQSTTLSEIEEAEVDSEAGVNIKTNQENQAAAILKLGIGDIYKGGIIFTIDPWNETGKIANMDDEGPMTWNKAMNIHEQLGEGWRLPTLDELRLMYKNIGQGAKNRGEFADELYWSATPFDDYQARLLRFSDGNASYHYNSTGTFRKFRVRAIKDFTR